VARTKSKAARDIKKKSGLPDKIQPDEAAIVLQRLLAVHPELLAEAEEIARMTLGDVSFESIAGDVEKVSGLYTMIEDNRTTSLFHSKRWFSERPSWWNGSTSRTMTILWLSASEGAMCGRFGWLIFRCPLLCPRGARGLPHICTGSGKKDQLIARKISSER
jgi:hypothetical protein